MICAGLAAVWESIKSTPWTACVFLRITSAKLWQFWRGPRAFFFFLNSWIFHEEARVFFTDFVWFCEILWKKFEIMKIFAIFKFWNENFWWILIIGWRKSCFHWNFNEKALCVPKVWGDVWWKYVYKYLRLAPSAPKSFAIFGFFLYKSIRFYDFNEKMIQFR